MTMTYVTPKLETIGVAASVLLGGLIAEVSDGVEGSRQHFIDQHSELQAEW
jgi:hypothetical protein